MTTVYLAGPDVFAPDAARRGAELKALCAAHGLVGVFPLDGGPAPGTPETPAAIRQHCLDAVRRCDVVVANLTPLRGPSVDPGTAYEMGFATALGKPVVGYTSDPRSHVDRVAATTGCGRDSHGVMRDAAGMAVEEFAIPLVDNLMVACGIVALFATAADAIMHIAGERRYRSSGVAPQPPDG